MVQCAVVVPDAPALVPGLGGTRSPELASLRDACLSAVRGCGRGSWLAVGPGDGPLAVSAAGPDLSLHEYGRLGRVDGRAGAARSDMPVPPALAVAAWLFDAAGVPPAPVRLVGASAGRDDLTGLVREAGSVDNLLVLGSGTFSWEPGDDTRHTDQPVDIAVRHALRDGDRDALRRLDPLECRAAAATGWAPWQVLAQSAATGEVTALVDYSGAPFGVTYHVATWRFRPAGRP